MRSRTEFQSLGGPIRNVGLDEVIGRNMLEIRQLWSMHPDEGLDYAWSYCRLDSGLVMALRFESIVATEMPRDTEPILHRFLDQVYGQTIERVLLAPKDRDWCGDDTPYVLFRNGFAISDIPVAPHGVDGVGILFFEPGELDLSKFRPLW